MALLWGLRGRDLTLCALVNVLTNPMAVLLHNIFPAPAVTAALELSVVAVEALCYQFMGTEIRRPWLLSLAANGFSYLAGVLLNPLINSII